MPENGNEELTRTRDGLMVGVLSILERTHFASTLVYAPPLEDPELKAIESEMGARFPHFYRRFLREVASGLSSSGDFGVLNISDAKRASPKANIPFPFSHNHARSCVASILNAAEAYDNGSLANSTWNTLNLPVALLNEHSLKFEGSVNGALLLHRSSRGRGENWLVLKGPLRSTVWTSNSGGWHPCFRVQKRDPEIHDFLSWLRAFTESV